MALSKVGGNQIDTVSGDLTVDTNTLVVDSTNNKVGIGTTSPTYQTTVYGSSQSTVEIESGSDTGESRLYFTDPTTTGVGEIGYYHNGNTMRFNVNNAERMRIDSGGNVGIGTSTPARTLSVHGGSAAGSVAIQSNGTGAGSGDGFLLQADTDTTAYIWNHENSNMVFATNNTQRFICDANGRFGIGTNPYGGYLTSILTNGASEYQLLCRTSNSSGTQYHVSFDRNGTQAGYITTNQNNQVFLNSGSDYRLKENISDMTDGIERVKQLQPKKFSFLANPDKEIVDGFLAHEVKDLVPQSVLGEKDAVDEDGNPIMQTINVSTLIPVLTGALKEAIAKIETLETQRADLETRLTALEAG